MISTYALCGFANFGSSKSKNIINYSLNCFCIIFDIYNKVGIVIGGLSALAPSRFRVFSKLALKAMIAGNLTNYISGIYEITF